MTLYKFKEYYYWITGFLMILGLILYIFVNQDYIWLMSPHMIYVFYIMIKGLI